MRQQNYNLLSYHIMNNTKDHLLHKIVKYGYKYELTKSADYKSRFDNYVDQYDILLGGGKLSEILKKLNVTDTDILKRFNVTDTDILKRFEIIIESYDEYKKRSKDDNYLNLPENKNLSILQIVINNFIDTFTEKINNAKGNDKNKHKQTLIMVLSILINKIDELKSGLNKELYNDIKNNKKFLEEKLNEITKIDKIIKKAGDDIEE